jgi:glutathione S-transferase
MYTLYFNPGAASFAVHWFLNDIDAPHELVLVDFDSKQQQSAEYLRLNPDGKVPALVIGDAAYTECAALLLLLAERHPEKSLAPKLGTGERAEFLQWMLFLANTLQPAYRAWFYPHEPAGEAHVDAVKAQARQRMEGIWDRIDAHLTGRTFFVGNVLTVLDFLATMLMRWSRNMPKPATDWSNIDAYVHRMRARPSYLKTLERERLTDWKNA